MGIIPMQEESTYPTITIVLMAFVIVPSSGSFFVVAADPGGG
jgi:hypothetical protein